MVQEGVRQREREVKTRNQHDHPSRGLDHLSDDARCTKRRTEDEGEHEEETRQDGKIVNLLERRGVEKEVHPWYGDDEGKLLWWKCRGE